MSQLNKIGLLWYITKNKPLIDQVKEALDVWNHRTETQDCVPDEIIFSVDQKDVLNIPDNGIFDLTITTAKRIRPNHFEITGTNK